jgi:hypothetical protein
LKQVVDINYTSATCNGCNDRQRRLSGTSHAKQND